MLEAPALDLAASALRDAIDHMNARRYLEVRNGAEKSRAKRLSVHRAVWGGHDGGVDVFAQRWMRNRIGHRLRDARQAHERLLDFEGRNLLTPSIDHLPDPTGQEQIAVMVEPADVT